MPAHRKLTPNDVELARTFYEVGETLDEVGARFSVKGHCISRYLKRAGVEIRFAGPAPKTVPRTCLHCGAEFEVREWQLRHRPALYCSTKCRGLSWRGEGSPIWKGDEATHPYTGHRRARQAVPLPELCEHEGCDKPPVERHHVDGNTFNNDPSNIRCLCRRHHMLEDGRTGQSRAQRKAKAA